MPSTARRLSLSPYGCTPRLSRNSNQKRSARAYPSHVYADGTPLIGSPLSHWWPATPCRSSDFERHGGHDGQPEEVLDGSRRGGCGEPGCGRPADVCGPAGRAPRGALPPYTRPWAQADILRRTVPRPAHPARPTVVPDPIYPGAESVGDLRTVPGEWWRQRSRPQQSPSSAPSPRPRSRRQTTPCR